MTEQQKINLDRLELDFETYWNIFCQHIPEAEKFVTIKDRVKFGKKYAKKYKSLCDAQQEQIKSPCLFDEFVSSLGNDSCKQEFHEEIKMIAKTIKLALNNALLFHSDSIVNGVNDIVRQMILTLDLNISANNPDYRNRLNEILVFNWLVECKNLTIHEIAYPLGNNKDCDFRCFHKDGTEFLIEVVSIHNIDLTKHDNAETFSVFINDKVQWKYADKSNGLEGITNLKIFPILDYVDNLVEFAPKIDTSISLPPFTVVKNIVADKSEILLTPIEKLKSDH